MLNKSLLLIFFTLATVVSGQVTMQVNLPAQMPLLKEEEITLRFIKGKITSFSKYEMRVQSGLTVREIDTHGGTFSSENNLVKIIWAITPAEEAYDVKLAIIPNGDKGIQTIQHKYFFVVNNEKRELEMEPLILEVVGEGAVSEAKEFRTVSSRLPSSLTSITVPDSLKKPEELSMQVQQLKKDSREAYSVGLAEKQKAQDNLTDAENSIRLANAMPKGEKRNLSLNKANEARIKAESDLAVANKILILAKTLEDNALEIERLTGPVNDSIAPEPVVKIKPVQEIILNEEPVIYRLQVGAFSKDPGVSRYRRYGKVSIMNENGVYKVMLGSYSTKDQALLYREEILKKGLDGFIVPFRNGVRIK